MSRRVAATGADTGAGVRIVGSIAFVVALAIVVLLLVRARPAPEPFDPRSGRDDGARGLVLTLEGAGAEVRIERSAPFPGVDGRVLVLVDALSDEQRSELLDFVDAGGVAVVADPTSTLHGGSDVDGGAVRVDGGGLAPGRLDATIEANLRPGDCTIEALGRLRGLVVPDGLLFPVGPDEPRCFTGGPSSAGGATSFVVVRSFGDGLIVGLGDNEPFQNRWLRGADNAGLAAALLVPERGSVVHVLVGTTASPTVDDVGSGDESLRDLVPTWAWMAMVLAAISFVLFAISRATRLGRVLEEPEATPIAGSELVVATGNLMQRAGHAPRAAWLIQHQLHRDLCAAYAVSLDAPLAELDRVVSERTGLAPTTIESTLRATAATDGTLVAVAARVADLRSIALDVTPSTSDSSPSPDTPSIPEETLVR